MKKISSKPLYGVFYKKKDVYVGPYLGLLFTNKEMKQIDFEWDMLEWRRDLKRKLYILKQTFV